MCQGPIGRVSTRLPAQTPPIPCKPFRKAISRQVHLLPNTIDKRVLSFSQPNVAILNTNCSIGCTLLRRADLKPLPVCFDIQLLVQLRVHSLKTTLRKSSSRGIGHP